MLTVDVTLRMHGSGAFRYGYDGSSAPHAAFDGNTLKNVTLTPGTAAIFRIDP
jgi:hypothetical protein